MPKITNEATMPRPDTDTTSDDVATPQDSTSPTPDSTATGLPEVAGQAAADATASGLARADTGPDTVDEGRDGPDPVATASTSTPRDGTPPTVARTATRSRSSAKPKVANAKVSDIAAKGITSKKKARTTTAATSAPVPDADHDGSPATSATTDNGPRPALVDVATAPTATPEPPMNGGATEDRIGTERPLRPVPSGKVRLKSGALQGLVEDFLTEHPGDHSPTAVGKAIARSSGAVANALERMVASGWAIRTCDKPKRYRIAEGSDSGRVDVATDDTGSEGNPTDMAARDGSAVDAAPPAIVPNGAQPDTETAPPVDADNVPPTAGRPTRRRTKTTT